MKLGLFAALTGIAVAIGLSRTKRTGEIAAPARKIAKPPAPSMPVTGTAPQEGIDEAAPPPPSGKANGGTRPAP